MKTEHADVDASRPAGQKPKSPYCITGTEAREPASRFCDMPRMLVDRCRHDTCGRSTADRSQQFAQTGSLASRGAGFDAADSFEFQVEKPFKTMS